MDCTTSKQIVMELMVVGLLVKMEAVVVSVAGQQQQQAQQQCLGNKTTVTVQERASNYKEFWGTS
jgi:hypothetical protein